MSKSINPIDGRYKSKTQDLSPFFSEEALIRERVKFEIDYFLELLCTLPNEIDKIPCSEIEELTSHFSNVLQSDELITEVKKLESTLNHDVKAAEVCVANIVEDFLGKKLKNFVHFGLTSADINSVSYTKLLKKAMERKIQPKIARIKHTLQLFGDKHINTIALAHTHGQPATPMSFGAQFLVFHERLTRQYDNLLNITYTCKIGGATGGLNAHMIAYPNIDWNSRLSEFAEDHLGLQRNLFTTQVDHNDHFSEILDTLKRIAVILLDLCRDTWMYISFGYLGQKVVEEEVGSSAMPHKVNPIDFENAEGNLNLAIGLFETISRTLPVSRMQRDLSNSTVTRNLGTAVSYLYLAMCSLEKGLDKIEVNEIMIKVYLNENYAVIGEAVQTLMRSWGVEDPYNRVKEFTRRSAVTGGLIDKECYEGWVNEQSDLSESQKVILKGITPSNYIPIFMTQFGQK